MAKVDPDRLWADRPTGTAALFAAAMYRDGGTVTITLPGGTTPDDDQALSNWLGRPVTLRAAAEPGERVFENPADFQHDTRWEPFNGSTGAFHDSGQANISLRSLATITGWQRRPFRERVILDGGSEDALVGSRVRLGGAELDNRQRIEALFASATMAQLANAVETAPNSTGRQRASLARALAHTPSPTRSAERGRAPRAGAPLDGSPCGLPDPRARRQQRQPRRSSLTGIFQQTRSA